MANLAELFVDGTNKGKMQLVSLSGEEGLSRPFEYQVEFLSPEPDLKLASFLGKSMTVALDLPDDKKRYFSGVVARFSQPGRRTKQFFHYQAVLRPSFWFLSRNQNCRIFQQQKLSDIVQTVLRDGGVTVKLPSYGSKNPTDYCVQYLESDMNFVSRLLEQEGGYYYFQHSQSGHEMIICNGPSSHSAFPGYETISYAATWAEGDQAEALRTWSIETQVLPSKVVLADFDYQKSGAPLSGMSQVKTDHPMPTPYEIFDYPGAYLPSASDLVHDAKMRAEELQAGFMLASGESDARGLCCGHTFKAESLPDDTQNVEYLVVSTSIYLEEGLQIGGDEGGLGKFSCQFQVMPTANTYRAPRVTPKPMIQGPQTAKVVGGKNDVHTDDEGFGRVKVLFHWDRLGAEAKNDKTSCWVRVSQPWAGQGFGMINLPRHGDEVVVSFLDADPDRPLITGRVYNDAFRPPFGLPENASVTGVRTQTMRSGGGPNELRFDDEPDKEYIWLKAQKDFHRVVTNNDHETVKADQYIQIVGKRQEAIDKDLEQTVKGNVKTAYAKDHHHKVTGDLIGQVDGVVNLKTTKDLALDALGKAGLSTLQGLDIKVGAGDAKLEAINVHIKGVSVTLEATAMLTLKVGGASIVINSGMITIDGPMVSINGGGSGGPASPANPAKPATPQQAEAPKAVADPLKPKKSK